MMEPFHAMSSNLDAYTRALRGWPAGAVSLDADEDASMAQLLLLRAASLLDLSVVTGWRDGGRVLLWRRVALGVSSRVNA
jgi:hypothetical protein